MRCSLSAAPFCESEKREVACERTGTQGIMFTERTRTLFIMSLSSQEQETQETALPLLSFTFLTKVDRSKMGM